MVSKTVEFFRIANGARKFSIACRPFAYRCLSSSQHQQPSIQCTSKHFPIQASFRKGCRRLCSFFRLQTALEYRYIAYIPFAIHKCTMVVRATTTTTTFTRLPLANHPNEDQKLLVSQDCKRRWSIECRIHPVCRIHRSENRTIRFIIESYSF
jgi:hypothetical protein